MKKRKHECHFCPETFNHITTRFHHMTKVHPYEYAESQGKVFSGRQNR